MSLRNQVRGDPPREESRLTREDVFSLLSNRRRRYVLYSLRSEDGTTTIGDLATRIAAWEAEVAPAAVGSRRRKVVYNSLQQSHLPRLAENDLVVYDREAGTVDLTDRGARVGDYLARVPGRDRRWGWLYLGLAGVACLVAVAHLGGVPPVAGVAGEVWFTLFAATLLFVAVGNVSTEYVGRSSVEEPPERTGEEG
ncbi:DUF7344 domain-containing protein [Candidatus Halobonum tyrrellensis]|uniref:DUF7344 domain-containing protein n=1 Tax=Candidatus Halobonum tyrrellensis G22 TaxID=1324957 RepID=V4HGF8_9EURY|nr:hypothetical protein [Candidatus Halobonum tyrrellensis]ESP86884.1 hypothetical protein K933_16522 [Candidatus Halobonum tyrrellensis G22]